MNKITKFFKGAGDSRFPTAASSTSLTETKTGEEAASSDPPEPIPPTDVAFLVDKYQKEPLTTDERISIVDEFPCPKLQSDYPRNPVNKRTFSPAWLAKYPWLVWSPAKSGAYCRLCVATGVGAKSGVGRGGHQTAAQLIQAPYRNWQKALEFFKAHENTEYHKNAKVDVCSLKRMQKQDDNVKKQMSAALAKEDKEKLAYLTRLFDIICMAGRQELPLRGHREQLEQIDDPHGANPGVYLAIVGLIRHADPAFKHWLDRSVSKYLHHESQNEMIDLASGEILNQIIQKVEANGGIFAIMADETADISRVEQMSVCIRYLDKAEQRMEERFLSFVPMESRTGEAIADALIKKIQEVGLNMSKCCGQGYDGAAAMSGCVKGVKTRVLRRYPNATYVHCSSHTANLAFSDVIHVPVIRSAYEVVKSVAVWFGDSPLRTRFLQENDELDANEGRRRKLLLYCKTRFVARFEAVTHFDENYRAMLDALEIMSASQGSKEVRDGADMKQACLRRFETVFGIKFLASLSKILSQQTTSLQSRQMTLLKAMEQIMDVVEQLETNASDRAAFSSVWDVALTFAEKHDIDVTLPASMRRKVGNRDVKTFYREKVFETYQQSLAQSLRERFGQHQKIVYRLQGLIPAHRGIVDASQLLDTMSQYEGMHGVGRVDCEMELSTWTKYWDRVQKRAGASELPSGVLGSYKECDADMFPAIKICLQVFACLPSTSCEAERTFSGLKRLKTAIRNSTGQDRLTGLLHLSANRDIRIDTEKLAKTFMETKKRRN